MSDGVIALVIHRFNRSTILTLDQHLDGAVRELQKLQDVGDGSDLIKVVYRRHVVGGISLGNQQHLLIIGHGLLEGLNGLFAPNKER